MSMNNPKGFDVKVFNRNVAKALKNLDHPRRALGDISTNVVANEQRVQKDAGKAHVPGNLKKPNPKAIPARENPNETCVVPAERPVNETYVVPAERTVPWNSIPDSGEQRNRDDQESNVAEHDSSYDLRIYHPIQYSQVQKQALRMGNLFSGVPYQEDIINYLKHREMLFMPNPKYMERQPQITYTKRMALINWLVEVAEEYELSRSSLFSTVYIVDMFLSKMTVVQDKLQLLGSAAMLIASKFEEILGMDLTDFVHLMDGIYTRREILRMEICIARILEFNFSVPTACTFIKAMDSYGVVPDEVLALAMFLCELTLLDAETYLPFRPSLVASGALALAYNCCSYTVVWPDALARATGYNLKRLADVVKALNGTHSKCYTSRYQAVITKYSSGVHLFASDRPHRELRIF